MIRQFSPVNEGDLKDGYYSDEELGHFYDSADGMAKILEDEEPRFESLGTLSITLTPPEVTTELLITLSN